MQDIQKILGLNRERLIILALFLGCDYTEGVSGVGIVNGMEIVNGFSDFESLYRFKEWARNPDLWTKPELYNQAKEFHQSEFDFMVAHKNYKNSWFISDSFPQLDVIEAFLSPVVLDNVDLQWIEPDTKNLINYCNDFIPMDTTEMEMFIEPLVKEFERRRNKPNSNKIKKGHEEASKSVQIGKVVSKRLLATIESLKDENKRNGINIFSGIFKEKRKRESNPVKDHLDPNFKRQKNLSNINEEEKPRKKSSRRTNYYE